MAQQARRAVSSNAAQPGNLRIADLPQGNGLTDRYDGALLKLCDSTTHALHGSISDNATRFCHHVRHAMNADTAYLCNRASMNIVATSSTDSMEKTCEDTHEIHAALTTMVSDLWNCTTPLCPPDIKVYPNESCFSYGIIPLDTMHDHLLVIVNAEIDTALIGDFIAFTLSKTYEVFLQTSQPTPTALKSIVLDALHAKYQLSSPTVTGQRFELFCNQVRESAADFIGLSLVNNKDKADALRTKLPAELYATAALWQGKFRAKLDQHCLMESAYGYKTLCDNENLSKFSDGRLLKIRVHAETLTDYGFIESLRDLTEKAIVHSSRLSFSVIPAPGIEHKENLAKLCTRFNIPNPATQIDTNQVTVKPTTAQANIADEFNVMQINGLAGNNSNYKSHKKNKN